MLIRKSAPTRNYVIAGLTRNLLSIKAISFIPFFV